MLWALAQEGHTALETVGAPAFDWDIYSFCDIKRKHALFNCEVIRAQVQSLATHGII